MRNSRLLMINGKFLARISFGAVVVTLYNPLNCGIWDIYLL